MQQPACGCFAHVDLDGYRLARCVHGEFGDPQASPTAVIVAAPPIFLTADAES